MLTFVRSSLALPGYKLIVDQSWKYLVLVSARSGFVTWLHRGYM